jgi:hypothetical protein
MIRRRATLFAIGLAVLTATITGCDRRNESKPPAVCSSSVDAVLVALRAAPGPARLDGDVALSTCLNKSRSDADLQTIGALLTAAGDRLALTVDGNDTAALQLGYLVGAARRGASTTNGIHAEIIRRLEQTTGLDGPAPSRRAAYVRGLRAGERLG